MSLPTDPYDFPSNVLSGISIKTDSRVAVTENPFNFKRQKFAYAGARWRLEAQTTNMKKERAEEIISKLVALNGPERLLHIGDPLRTSLLGNEDGSNGGPTVYSDASAGEDILQLDDLNPAASNPAFKAGDWIELGSGATRRIYKIVGDANGNNQSLGDVYKRDLDSDGAEDEAEVYIWPPLRENANQGNSVGISDTKGTFELENPIQWPWEISEFSSFSFNVVEAL